MNLKFNQEHLVHMFFIKKFSKYFKIQVQEQK